MSDGTGAGQKPTAAKGGTQKATAAEVRLAEIAAELRSKPGTWTILGIVLAALALPTGVLGTWFVREIDQVKELMRSYGATASEAATASKNAADNSAAVRDQIDSLVVAMARSSAKPIDSEERLITFQKLFPKDLVSALQREDGGLSYIRHSNFNETQWIFINSDDFNLLESSVQSRLKESVDQMDARLEIVFTY